MKIPVVAAAVRWIHAPVALPQLVSFHSFENFNSLNSTVTRECGRKINSTVVKIKGKEMCLLINRFAKIRVQCIDICKRKKKSENLKTNTKKVAC